MRNRFAVVLLLLVASVSAQAAALIIPTAGQVDLALVFPNGGSTFFAFGGSAVGLGLDLGTNSLLTEVIVTTGPGNVTLAVANAAITELLIMNFDLNSAVIDGLSVVLPGTSTPSGPLTDPTLLAFSGSVFALFSLSGDPVEFDGGVFFPYVLSYLVAPDGPSEVPEPGVATTMALGLVAIGAGLYRRRRS